MLAHVDFPQHLLDGSSLGALLSRESPPHGTYLLDSTTERLISDMEFMTVYLIVHTGVG